MHQQKSRSASIINNDNLVKSALKFQQQEATYNSNRQPEQNAPILKISAPPESDENLHYSSSLLQFEQENNLNPTTNKNITKDNQQQQLDQPQSAIFLTTQNKIPERSGSRKSSSSNKENNYLDSLSSTMSIDGMRSQASSQRTLVVNDDQLNKSFESINVQSTEVLKGNIMPNDKITKKDIAKSSNTLTISGHEKSNKNTFISSSMSSIVSSRKLSIDSISADVESDNFSKYFPSSRENSPGHSRTESSLDVNSEKSKQSNKSDNVKNSGKDDKNKEKSKLPFKLPKRSLSVLNKTSKNSESLGDNRKDSSAKNPLKPFGEIQVSNFYFY
jgi:hypothetical protein